MKRIECKLSRCLYWIIAMLTPWHIQAADVCQNFILPVPEQGYFDADYPFDDKVLSGGIYGAGISTVRLCIAVARPASGGGQQQVQACIDQAAGDEGSEWAIAMDELLGKLNQQLSIMGLTLQGDINEVVNLSLMYLDDKGKPINNLTRTGQFNVFDEDFYPKFYDGSVVKSARHNNEKNKLMLDGFTWRQKGAPHYEIVGLQVNFNGNGFGALGTPSASLMGDVGLNSDECITEVHVFMNNNTLMGLRMKTNQSSQADLIVGLSQDRMIQSPDKVFSAPEGFYINGFEFIDDAQGVKAIRPHYNEKTVLCR